MSLRASIAVLALAVVLGGCERVPVMPEPPSPEIIPVPGLYVMVLWNALAELDMLLTDPSGETLSRKNNPSRSGARLLRDGGCDDILELRPPFQETAFMLQPDPGVYRVRLEYPSACGERGDPVRYEVVVEWNGLRREALGTLELKGSDPAALEFELRALGQGGQLVLVGGE